MGLLKFHLDTNWPPVKWQKQPILPARFLPFSAASLSTIVPSQPTLSPLQSSSHRHSLQNALLSSLDGLLIK